MKRRLIFAAMCLVTAWSLWAFAQTQAPKRPPAHHAPAGAVPAPGQPGARPVPPPRPMPPLGATPPPAPSPRVAPPKPPEPPKAEPRAEAKEEPESEEPGAFNLTEFGGETPPYLAMVINFGILVAGYYLLGKKPIATALQSRRDSVAKEIEEAQRMRKEAEERAKVYQAKLERLEDEARTAREALVRAGEAERERIVAEAEATAERMRKDAQFLVEQELKQIRQDLLRDTMDAAVGAAEELLRKRMTAADHERLAEDYLANLGGRKASIDAARPSRAEAGDPS